MAAATAQLASFETGHGDMVHDAAFDYYGKRLATCSSDRAIKVFEVVGEQVRPRRCCRPAGVLLESLFLVAAAVRSHKAEGGGDRRAEARHVGVNLAAQPGSRDCVLCGLA